MSLSDDDLKKIRNRAYKSVWYQKNQAGHKAKALKNKQRYREEWRTWKSTLACTKCGFSHPAALDFHHPTSEKQDINHLLRQGRFAAAKKEALKCIVLCANCHRIHHHSELLKNKDGSQNLSQLDAQTKKSQKP